MTIYLCPSDKKYTCSWEGPAEDILSHFEQEHDDLLYFSNTFIIDLLINSENRLFLVDEEIYLTQTFISNNKLNVRLRYLGPMKLAGQISYNIVFKVGKNQVFNCVEVTTEGVNVDLIKLEEEFAGVQELQCTLNINKQFQKDDSDDSVFSDGNVHENEFEKLEPVPIEEILSSSTLCDVKEELPSHEVTLSRSKTISYEEIKRKNVRRTKSTLSLGPIKENDNTINCFECETVLQPPIFVCPCGQNFCRTCQKGNCKQCEEKITFERNVDLEDKYNKYLYPCKYKKIGCPEKLIYTELNRHEINCSFCEYKCPIARCQLECQFKAMVGHFKLLHPSVKILESFIVVFQQAPEVLLVNEERGIFHCYVEYLQDSVLWEAKFCGPKERSFFCELKFKDGKLKQPILLRKNENVYSVRMGFVELKRMKLKAKNAVLTISG